MQAVGKPVFLLLTLQVIVWGQPAVLQRGQPCGQSARFHPKFRVAKTCDATKGLECITSYNPEYAQGAYGSTFCDCPEDYYFDANSNECRIQVGYACDPAEESSKEWNKKCPQNAYCSTNIGRYGPRGARGMCRCQDGYYVSSIWFTEGGGSVCQKEEQVRDFQLYFDNDV